MLYIWPVVDLPFDEINGIARRLTPLTEGLGLEQVVVSGRLQLPASTEPVDAVMRLGYEPGHGLTVRITEPPTAPMQPLDDYTRKRIQTRRRGLVHPYELAPMLAGPGGSFVEHDLDDAGSARRRSSASPGSNRAGVVVGVVTTPRDGLSGRDHPRRRARRPDQGDGRDRRGRVCADHRRHRPGGGDGRADRVVRPVRRGEDRHGLRQREPRLGRPRAAPARRAHPAAVARVNVVVAGINVGAQPYWNAEATMLMHTSGILVMTPESAMVLTGKQAIDYSGGVSAEDNLGIGGYARIMGPNGEAQYFAPTIGARRRHAVRALPPHLPGARRALAAHGSPTADPADRDVRTSSARRRGQRVHDGRRDLLRHRRTATARSPSTSAR